MKSIKLQGEPQFNIFQHRQQPQQHDADEQDYDQREHQNQQSRHQIQHQNQQHGHQFQQSPEYDDGSYKEEPNAPINDDRYGAYEFGHQITHNAPPHGGSHFPQQQQHSHGTLHHQQPEQDY